MSENIAIRLSDVGKMYKLFPNRIDFALDALSLGWLLPGHKTRCREFWALRNINLTVYRGQRLGVIGRNGAGKSTLLKLLSGNYAPTEGQVAVNGQVQALMDAGSYFHPEFTGYENIEASLTYQGLGPDEIKSAIHEIAEFTELGDFLGQPLKSYSAGMEARLAFATATTLQPEILIIDEVLGAGDAYFLAKSSERMKKLTEESGATVLIVSHDLQQIVRFCQEAIWIERGRIIQQGTSLEVVKAYQEFIHNLDERRLRARNRQRATGKHGFSLAGQSTDAIRLNFVISDQTGSRGDVSEIAVYGGNSILEQLHLGSAQDDNESQFAYVLLDGASSWSQPLREGSATYRSLIRNRRASSVPADLQGQVVLNFDYFPEDVTHMVTVRYRKIGKAPLVMQIWRGNKLHTSAELPESNGRWATYSLEMKPPLQTQDGELEHATTATQTRKARRWSGEGSLSIAHVSLLNSYGKEQAVFRAGETMTLKMTIRSHRSGKHTIIPVAVIYRLDGIVVSTHTGQPASLVLESNEACEVRLTFRSLILGDGDYVFSVAIYKKLFGPSEGQAYDLIDRSYEFQVVGNDPLQTGILNHPAEWILP